MNRTLIIVLTVVTALIHLVVLNLGGEIFPLFVLNGLGYFALLGAWLWDFPKGQARLVHYAFMAYTAVTIVAWVFMGTRGFLGFGTKAIELTLLYLLWQSEQSLPKK